jgi:hypothetical protein
MQLSKVIAIKKALAAGLAGQMAILCMGGCVKDGGGGFSFPQFFIFKFSVQIKDTCEQEFFD